MEEVLTKLGCTDDKNEILVLLEKALKIVEKSSGDVNSLRFVDSSTLDETENDFDEKEFITFIANHFVTIFLYYHDEDEDIFKSASDVILALLLEFPNLQSILGQSGLYDNLARFMKQYFLDRNSFSSHDIGYYYMRLLLGMTYGCSRNIVKCAEMDLFHVAEQYLQVNFTAFDPYLASLKLLSFLIGDGEHELDEVEVFGNIHNICNIWRQQCFVQESRRHSSVGSVITEIKSTVLARILALMNSFLIDSDEVQIYGLRCLNVLVSTEGAHEALWTEGAFDTVIHACYHCITCEEIQHLGFSLLKQLLFRSLCNEKVSNDTDTHLSRILLSKYDMIGRVLKGSLTTYSHHVDILISVCDIIKVLILTSDNLATDMIKDGIPKTLYILFDELNTDTQYNTSRNGEDKKNHVLSCIQLFAADSKYCELTADSFLECGSHYPTSITCMVLLGANIYETDLDRQSLLLQACIRSQYCVINSMLSLDHYFNLHGIRSINLGDLKSVIKNSCHHATYNVTVVAILLRHLMQHGDASVIDWKDLGLHELDKKSLGAIFDTEDQNLQFNDFEQTKNNLESGFRLSFIVLKSTWDTVNCDEGLSNILRNKYMQAIGSLKTRPAQQLTVDQCVLPVYSFPCLCDTNTRTSVNESERKRVEFEEHLHISFDDNNQEKKKECFSENSEPDDANTLCERCSMLLGKDCSSIKSFESNAVSSDLPTTMDISHNAFKSITFLKELSMCMSVLANLEKFDCGNNPITHITCSIASLLCNVKELKLDNACLTEFPIGILVHCTHLVCLDVSHNKIEDWPDHVSVAEGVLHFSLSVLKISDNILRCFPFFLCTMLKKLKILDLSNNNIRELKTENGDSDDISISETVNLSCNAIEKLPMCFFNMFSKLKHLDVSNNRITELAEDVAHNSNILLNRINLSHNSLDSFPSVLLQFRLLKILNVSHNHISILSSSITPIAQLRDLDLTENKIDDISEFLRNVSGTWMHSLKSFKVANNNLEIAPSELGLLRNLEVLDLRNNRLTQVSNQIGRLSKLYQLSLLGNNLDIDPDLLAGRTQELRSYFFSRLKNSEERLKTNVIMFSSPSAWQSSFLKLLKSKHGLEEIKSKHDCGVTIHRWSLETGKRNFSLTLCDVSLTPGSFLENYPQIAISDCALYIVISGENCQTDFSNTLLKSIQEFAPNCPVIHVNLSNSSKSTDKAASRTGLPRPGYPSHCQELYFDCVLPEASHIQEFASCVSSILTEYKVKGDHMFINLVPKNYILLEEIFLEARKSLSNFPVLSYSSLIDFIQQNDRLRLNLEDGEELLTAIHFLTRFGVIWHQDDPRKNLRNYFILNPLWLIDIFQKVLTSLQEKMNRSENDTEKYLVSKYLMEEIIGKVVIDEVAQKENDIKITSKSFVPVLIRLMQNRGLFFLVDEDTYFVPGFLKISPPDVHFDNNEYKKNLTRIFEMEYIPVNFWHHIISGIFQISKFVDASHELRVFCWKSGIVVLRNSDLLFFIKQVSNTEERTKWSRLLSTNGKMVIEIQINRNDQKQIMPLVMDHINNTIEEWFPDLLEFDICGKQHVVQYIPCENCLLNDNNNKIVHLFTLDELIKTVELNGINTTAICPNHSDVQLELDDMISDVLLQDFGRIFSLDASELLFKTDQENLLGEGGFGTVFRGKYSGRDVAIKSLRAGSSTPAYINLRNELNVLGKLSHPSIISLIGYLINFKNQPMTMLVMELAREGSLTNYLFSLENLSVTEALVTFPRYMRLRVVQQVLEGVAFMHEHQIIYRDLKPDNVLVMTLDQNQPLNVKLVDFGIAVPSIPSGTVGGCGSPGYSAPEVVSLKLRKKDGLWNRIPYTNSCDIFAFGLLLYEVIVCRTPWFMHTSSISAGSTLPNVPDEAIMKGVLPSSLTSFDVNMRWPHMQDIISSCLRRNPDDRPTAEQILDLMKTPEICCFRNHIDIGNASPMCQLSSAVMVQDSTDQLDDGFGVGGRQNIQICTTLPKTLVSASDVKSNSQTSIKVVTVSRESTQIISQTSYEIPNKFGDISAILCIPHKFDNKNNGDHDQVQKSGNKKVVIVGTEKGQLFLLEIDTSKSILISNLPSKIECFHLYESKIFHTEDLIFAGLESGHVAIFSIQQVLLLKITKPLHMMNLCQYYGPSPVRNFVSNQDSVCVTCSKHILCIGVKGKNPPTILKTKMLSKTSLKNSSCLQNIAVYQGSIFASRQSSSNLTYWTENSIFPNFEKDIFSFLNNSDNKISTALCKITSLISDEFQNILYVGLSTGFIMLFNCKKEISDVLQSIRVIHRHTGPVWNIFLVKDYSQKQDKIVAFGVGFNSTSNDCIWRHSKIRLSVDTIDDLKQSCATFYDANLHEIAADMESIVQKRKLLQPK